MQEPAIFFGPKANYDGLCAITIFGVKTEENSSFQAHVIRCREMIFTEPDIIASPSVEMDNCFYLIMQKQLFVSGKIQQRLEKKCRQISEPYRVLPALFQSCLLYTIIAKLAPQWNKAGEWLLQGRDFVTNNGYKNAVKMALKVNANEVYMSLTGSAIRSSQLKVEDLDVNTQHLEGLLKGDPLFEALELYQWCYVLPSMKRGRIISVSRCIPTYPCPFQTYKDLKKHWKNTYGYRLPETDDDMLYYEVSFLPLGGRIFTYPSVCLRNHRLHSLPRVDQKSILGLFLKDLHSKVQLVCGYPFQFQPKVCYAETELITSSQVQPGQKPNLTARNSAASIPFRQVSQLKHHPVDSNSRVNSKMNLNQKICKQSNDLDVNMKNIPKECHEAEKDRYTSKQLASTNKTLTNSNRNINTQKTDNGDQSKESMNKDSSQANKSQRIIPVFKPKAKSFKKETQPSVSKTVPTFSVKRKPEIFRKSQKPPSPSNISKTSSPQDNQSRAIPLFTAHKKAAVFQSCESTKKISKGSCKNSGIKPNFSQKLLKTTTFQNTSKVNSNQSLTMKPPSTPTSQLFTISDKVETSFDIYFQSAANLPPMPSTPTSTPTPKLSTPKLSQATPEPNNLLNTPKSTTIKRKEERTPCSEGNGDIKKPRAKPKVQYIDVEQLARSGQLSKANAITLTTWLKARNIQCKCKDKKGDLVEKVLSFLNLTKPVELLTAMQSSEQ